MKIDIVTASNNADFQDACECLRNLTSIPKGSIPLARGMGLDWANLSEAQADIENEYAVDVVDQVQEYEQRVSVKKVEFEHEEGEAHVKIIVEGGEDE